MASRKYTAHTTESIVRVRAGLWEDIVDTLPLRLGKARSPFAVAPFLQWWDKGAVPQPRLARARVLGALFRTRKAPAASLPPAVQGPLLPLGQMGFKGL